MFQMMGKTFNNSVVQRVDPSKVTNQGLISSPPCGLLNVLMKPAQVSSPHWLAATWSVSSNLLHDKAYYF